MRLLYIALVAVLLGTPAVARAQVGDECAGSADGATCLDDDDPCTLDRCADETCRHVDVPNRATCDPVLDAYRRTLGLRDLVTDLTSQLAPIGLPDTARVLVDDALEATQFELVRASDALAGRIVVPPPAAGETLAQSRARAAFGICRVTPPRVRGVLRVLAVPAVRASIGPTSVDLARRVRFLYRSANQLKRELRRLQRVSGVFAR